MSLTSPSTQIATAEAFARTYAPPNYADPYEAVKEYERVMKVASKYPSKGSAALATTVGLPRGRIRGWVEGSKPDCVRGLDVAREHGWLPLVRDDDLRPWATLVAWVFSGGSIGAQWRPSFVANRDQSQAMVEQALGDIGLASTLVERESGRATEVQPATDASVLGRVLHILGAPAGPKTEVDVEFPQWVRDAPAVTQIRFAETYLHNRAHVRDNGIVSLREERPDQYLDDLAAFFSALAGAPVRANGKNVVFSLEAADALGARQIVE